MIAMQSAGQIGFGPGAPARRGLQALLLHCNGSNGSTTVTDSSANGRTPTLSASAALSTAQQKFGSASLACIGASDKAVWGNYSGFNFGLGDLTWRAFVRFTSILAQNQVADFRPGSGVQPVFYVVSGQLRMFVDGSDRITGGTISVDTWHCIEWSRVLGTSRLYLDGVQIGSSYTDANNYDGAELTLGSVVGRQCSGYYDEVEVLKGEGLWAGSASVPVTGEIATR